MKISKPVCRWLICEIEDETLQSSTFNNEEDCGWPFAKKFLFDFLSNFLIFFCLKCWITSDLVYILMMMSCQKKGGSPKDATLAMLQTGRIVKQNVPQNCCEATSWSLRGCCFADVALIFVYLDATSSKWHPRGINRDPLGLLTYHDTLAAAARWGKI